MPTDISGGPDQWLVVADDILHTEKPIELVLEEQYLLPQGHIDISRLTVLSTQNHATMGGAWWTQPNEVKVLSMLQQVGSNIARDYQVVRVQSLVEIGYPRINLHCCYLAVSPVPRVAAYTAISVKHSQ